MNKTLLSLALAAAPLAAFPDVLVSQPSSFVAATNAANVGFYSDAASTNGSQYYHETDADNFALTSTSVLSSIVFYGSSEYYQYAGLTNVASFQVQILNSSFASVYSTTVAKSALTPTATGATNNAGGTEYAFTLGGLSQGLAAGTYYLNVGAILADATSDSFAWSGSAVGNHYTNDLSGTAGYAASGTAQNLAFVINGVQATPEPSSLAAVGLAALVVLRRRARR